PVITVRLDNRFDLGALLGQFHDSGMVVVHSRIGQQTVQFFVPGFDPVQPVKHTISSCAPARTVIRHDAGSPSYGSILAYLRLLVRGRNQWAGSALARRRYPRTRPLP